LKTALNCCASFFSSASGFAHLFQSARSGAWSRSASVSLRAGVRDTRQVSSAQLRASPTKTKEREGEGRGDAPPKLEREPALARLDPVHEALAPGEVHLEVLGPLAVLLCAAVERRRVRHLVERVAELGALRDKGRLGLGRERRGDGADLRARAEWGERASAVGFGAFKESRPCVRHPAAPPKPDAREGRKQPRAQRTCTWACPPLPELRATSNATSSAPKLL